MNEHAHGELELVVGEAGDVDVLHLPVPPVGEQHVV